MQLIKTSIELVKIIVPDVYKDDRGFFMESYHQEKFDSLIGGSHRFVQDNHSRSVKNVIRGLHYQIGRPQGKLVRVLRGEIFDVAVDVKRGSPTFGMVVTCRLSDVNHHQLWVPPHFAHGFLVLSDVADVVYKTTDFYAPKDERCIRWDDPDLAIEWPLKADPLLSLKDGEGVSFADAEYFP